MRVFSFRSGALSVGLLLVLAGVWFVVRDLFQLGPWFAPATLLTLTAGAVIGWIVSRRTRWLTASFFLGSWTLYKALDAWWFGGTLPGSFLPAFWAFGFLLLYQFGTRPFRWPLFLAGPLLTLATVMYVVSVGIFTAKYWIPGALVVWGIYLILRGARGGPGNYLP